jgi:hypothetical protein
MTNYRGGKTGAVKSAGGLLSEPLLLGSRRALLLKRQNTLAPTNNTLAPPNKSGDERRATKERKAKVQRGTELGPLCSPVSTRCVPPFCAGPPCGVASPPHCGPARALGSVA